MENQKTGDDKGESTNKDYAKIKINIEQKMMKVNTSDDDKKIVEDALKDCTFVPIEFSIEWISILFTFRELALSGNFCDDFKSNQGEPNGRRKLKLWNQRIPSNEKLV